MSAAPSRSSAARGRIFCFRVRKGGGASTSLTSRLPSALRMAAAILAIWCAPSLARDLGQWENTDPELRVWYQALKQPDNPNISCCGEADAYWCDDVYVRGDATFCKITDTRDDTELRRPHIDVGTEIYIPPHKYGPAKGGNPTRHTIIFLSYQRNVYCFVQGFGT